MRVLLQRDTFPSEMLLDLSVAFCQVQAVMQAP
jgi:hypothetical protein